eukprot:CAMPEP_0197577976 /NCGR_PEP_ID=MMETSP1326-20131121/2398_1 /TAXON_ID=1155430 /ORGANISM="Genus nov. species nov., Strain RCC2288" /LENGTH=136 /DNA_ID=CAMNT_0043141121 /DNA_START=891 /DNA_END=1298 /DNA_ORIENTATION=-
MTHSHPRSVGRLPPSAASRRRGVVDPSDARRARHPRSPAAPAAAAAATRASPATAAAVQGPGPALLAGLLPVLVAEVGRDHGLEERGDDVDEPPEEVADDAEAPHRALPHHGAVGDVRHCGCTRTHATPRVLPPLA